MKFIRNTTNIDSKKLNEFSERFHTTKSAMELLFSRGIDNLESINSFLNPNIDNLYDPYLLIDMGNVVDRINYHTGKGSRILILGDYDTDGICSSSILYKYFESIGVNADVFLPNRMIDGYGLTLDTAKKILSKYKPDLIITVDCGISSHDEIEYLKSAGVEVIVTDHHEIPDIVPECLIIDPKLPSNKEKYPFCDLCGAGVALKVVQALAGLDVAKKYVTIAAIATVADMVSLVDENRIIVKYGLENFKANAPQGILKLAKSLDITNISSLDISYKLAPRLNTAGRIDDAMIAFRLFVSNDAREISSTLVELKALNDERVKSCNDAFDECDKILSNTNISHIGAIVLKGEWHQGIVGIVCARILEKYHRPVCILTKVDDEYKGSIRSVAGINIFDALCHTSKYLIRFGGHSLAGGLALEEKNIDAFSKELSDYILSKYDMSYFDDVKYYDLEYCAKELNYSEIMSHEILSPFGFGNPKPVYKINFENEKFVSMPKHKEHIKYYTKDVEIVAFNSSYALNYFDTTCEKSAIVEFDRDTYTKKEKLKGKVKCFNFGSILTPIYLDRQTASLIPYFKDSEAKILDTTDCDIENILHSSYGTIILSNTFASYNTFIRSHPDISTNLYNLEVFNGSNVVVLCPENVNFTNYDNIIFLDYIDISYYDKFEGKNVILLSRLDSSVFKNISTDRGDLGAYYKVIENVAKRKIIGNSKYDYFKLSKKLSPEYRGMKYDMFSFTIAVFTELKLIREIIDNSLYKIEILNSKKQNLDMSSTYKTACKILRKE